MHTIICSSTLFIFVMDYLVNGVRVNLRQGVGIGVGLIGMLMATNCEVIVDWVTGSE